MTNRPLTKYPDSLVETPALTQNMLLTFERRPVYNPGQFDEKDVYSKRWQPRAQNFCDKLDRKRWVKKYFPLLRQHQKWTHPRPDIHIDDIVLLEEENTPRGEWPLAQVIALQTGLDGHTQSAKLLARDKKDSSG